MNTNPENKITTEGIKNIAIAAGALAGGASALRVASATEGFNTSIDSLATNVGDLAASQAEVAVGMGELADAEVTGSIIGAIGDVIGGFLEGLSS